MYTIDLPLYWEISINFLKPNHDDIIVDIGGSDGALGRALLLTNTPCKEYVCIDININALRLGRAVNGSNTHFICADAAHLPLRNSSITKIALLETIEHLQDSILKRCLAECKRVLRDSGVLVISPLLFKLRYKPHDGYMVVNRP
jgi:ubiquinone/menaquinone biosynthesis C-methylase UbiE